MVSVSIDSVLRFISKSGSQRSEGVYILLFENGVVVSTDAAAAAAAVEVAVAEE